MYRHGDKCAGVIAAVLNNSECGVGLAYKARLGGKAIITLMNFSKNWFVVSKKSGKIPGICFM